MIRRLAAFAALALPLAAQSPKGTLVIVGGGPDSPAVEREFVRLAGGPGKARVVIFAMASSVPGESGEERVQELKALGAEGRNVIINRAEADADSIVRLVREAGGVWFNGGDQSRLTAVLKGTAVERAIHDAYQRGAVIGGTSAGAAVMSAIMITGNERRPGGARRDSTQNWITIDRDDVITSDGFALVNNVIVDQHFLRRRRHNRLISLVLERAPHLGAGIDESTALIIRPDGSWQVLGESVVTIYDARRATVAAAPSPLGARDVALHILPSGATFDPAAGRARLP